MKKSAGILVVAVAVVLVGPLLARNMLIKAAAKRALRDATGFDLTLEKIQVGLFSSTVEIRNLSLLNPPGFHERTAFDIKELFVRYDLWSLFSDEVHLREVRLDIPSATVVRNEQGRSNMDRLLDTAGGDKDSKDTPAPRKEHPPEIAAGRPSQPAPAEGAQEPTPAKRGQALRIDDLHIRLGTVSYLDYSNGGPEPTVLRHALNVDLRRQDVTDLNEVAWAISGQVFLGGMGALADVAGAQFKQLSAGVGSALQDPDSELNQLLQSAREAATSEEVQQAAESVGQAADEISREIGQFFKNLKTASE